MRFSTTLMGVATLAIIAALAVALARTHQTRLRLVQEQRDLQQQLDQLTALSARNQELSNLVAQAHPATADAANPSPELLRLRGEVGRLRQQTRELEQARAQNGPALSGGSGPGRGTNAATADYWPQDSWSFAGYATPDAALQTSVWAAMNGDLQALTNGVTGAMQLMLAQELQGKSDAEFKARALDQVINLKSVRILNREAQSDNTAVLTAVFEDTPNPHTEKLILIKVGNQWKLAGPAQ